MRSRTPTRSARRSRARVPRGAPSWPRLPPLEQRQLDLIGLGLVALACFLTFVFYLGWDGGQVGDAIAEGLLLLFGAIGYTAPIALLAAGALLVLRPMLPALRPFRTGAICLVAGLTLGLAAGSLGVGPEQPPRREPFMSDPDFLRVHGGLVGEAVHWVARSLVQEIGVHILFVFLLLTGALLLTGGSVAGILRNTRAGVASTTRRVRESTTELTAIAARAHGGVTPSRAGGRLGRLLGREPGGEAGEALPDGVEPLVRATHVEAPAPPELDWSHAEIEAAGAVQVPEYDAAAERRATPATEGVDPSPEAGDGGATDLHAARLASTVEGRPRRGVAEADGVAYRLPGTDFLRRSSGRARVDRKAEEREAAQLVEALGHFGIEAKVIGAVSGPHVTRYELRLAPGTKMSKVAQLSDDLAYALAAEDVRILAPIPGKQAVGVEVPNQVKRTVHLGDVFQEAPAGWSPLTVWLGKDVAGQSIGADLAKQPHVLVAGTTGSGKSGCVNAMLASVLLRATPNEVKLVLVDPKQVELNYYDGLPHLLTPVVTSPRLAANVLANLIKEMEARYAVMSAARARNLIELNRSRERAGERPLPYVLCVIDELADLMMIAPGEVEDAIIRLAQKSRAVGIHLVLATQRPSADIITGMIKANVPARIAFAVSSQTDSRVILDQNGAETLLGEGDMLFRPASQSRLARVKGALVTEGEVEQLVEHWRRQGEPELQEELLEAVEPEDDEPDDFDPDADDLLPDAISTVVQLGTASTSMLQRRLRVGYTRAGRLIDMMERRGVISGYEGSKARQVLISEADLPRVLEGLSAPPVDDPPAPAGAAGQAVAAGREDPARP